MVIFEIFVLSSAIALASAGVSQYYVTPYSHSFPVVQHSSVPLPLLQPQQFNAAFLQNQILNLPQVYHAPPAFVSRSLNPFVPQPFSIAQPVVNVGHSQARSNSARNLAASEPNPTGGIEYGFGYRTQYDDGASSMVVFVMGPESQKLEIARGKNVAARKLSPNLVDGSTIDEQKSEEVNNVLSNDNLGLNINNLLEVYPIFKDLEQPKTSVFHLYSHPANVFQLTSPNLSPRVETPSTSTPSVPESTNNDDPESVAIESADIGRSLPSENESTDGESTTQETNVPSDNISSESSEETSQSSSTENSSESSSPSSTSTTTEESTEGNSDTVEATTSQ